jgi:LPXTG-motif cell wall-anchored protein
MLSTGFGEMGAFIAALGAIFGGVAAAFFVMSRKKSATATQ